MDASVEDQRNAQSDRRRLGEADANQIHICISFLSRVCGPICPILVPAFEDSDG